MRRIEIQSIEIQDVTGHRIRGMCRDMRGNKWLPTEKLRILFDRSKFQLEATGIWYGAALIDEANICFSRFKSVGVLRTKMVPSSAIKQIQRDGPGC